MNEKTNSNSELIELYKTFYSSTHVVTANRMKYNALCLVANMVLLLVILFNKVYLGNIIIGALLTFGVLYCFHWIKTIKHYNALNASKFKAINDFEEKLNIKLTAQAWQYMPNKSKGGSSFDLIVPFGFIALYCFCGLGLVL